MLLNRCCFCLAANSSQLKFDKRGRPYLTCALCRTRSFFSTLDALRGPAIVPQVLESLLDARAKGKAPWVDEKIRELRNFVVATTRGAMPQTEGPSMVPFVENDAKENVA